MNFYFEMALILRPLSLCQFMAILGILLVVGVCAFELGNYLFNEGLHEKHL